MYCIDILSVFLIIALSMQREIFLSIGLAGICSFTLPMVFGWDIEREELCISIPSFLRFSHLVFHLVSGYLIYGTSSPFLL
jgi:hypothetical protein